MSRIKQIALAAATVAAVGVPMVVATAPAAQAASRDGKCASGEFCYYYNSGAKGSVSDFTTSVGDYGAKQPSCYEFKGAGSGKGKCVKNNAAAVWNRTSKSVTVFFNSSYGGTRQTIRSGAKVNLVAALKNNNASHRIGAVPPPPPAATIRFPEATTQAKIKNNAPNWCYANQANCHHDYNAADIFNATGTRTLAPIAGTVKTVRLRSNSVGSTVTIQDSQGRLWYMAHMDDSPKPVVHPGQRVVAGQHIGYIGTSAHALGTPPHLHIDLLPAGAHNGSRPSCTGSGCSKLPFINVQPMLVKAFGALPVR